MSSSGSGATRSWDILGKEIGMKCLAALLAVGQSRLKKALAGTPDLRFGKKEHRFQAATWSVEAFLQVCYDSLAETLPDKYHALNCWSSLFLTFLVLYCGSIYIPY